MKYPYWKIALDDPEEPWIRRPLVNVTLRGPKRTLTFAALLDSGADHSLFHNDVAEALGIDLGACKQGKVAGIDGTPAASFLTEVPVTPENLNEVMIPIMFWEKQPIALIGQVGFFDFHRIRFERDHDTFEVIPVRRR